MASTSSGLDLWVNIELRNRNQEITFQNDMYDFGVKKPSVWDNSSQVQIQLLRIRNDALTLHETTREGVI